MKRSTGFIILLFASMLFGCETPVIIQPEDETPTITTTTVATSESSKTATATSETTHTIISSTIVSSTTISSTVTTTIVTTTPIEVIIPDMPSIKSFDYSSIPSYSNSPYCEVNDNIPFFDESDFTTESYEYYSPLDSLGRCGECVACIGMDLMPSGERGEIGSVRPTGFQLVRYDDIISDKYLYNRCHLIGWQLTGENANERNLITGTRYMNVEGMLPFENRVANYIKSTNNHVLYRVTPVFIDDELLARGVLMEAQSVEDDGFGVRFNVFCYNVQPRIYIDYSNGDNHLIDDTFIPIATIPDDSGSDRFIEDTSHSETRYILNTNTHKFHYPSCSSVDSMKEKNKQEYYGTRDDIISQGYEPCKRCNP